MTINSSHICTFPKNKLGRDFVAGDIHGAFSSVHQEMERVSFNEKHDRLFCGGDLVDYGAGSSRVLNFLSKPYMFSVRGNHEQMYINACEDDMDVSLDILAAIDFNGMGWSSDVSSAMRREILTAFLNLPLVIEIETERGLVGLVHGDVPAGMNWADFKEQIRLDNQDVVNTALRGRDRIRTENSDGVLGIDRIFVGHTRQTNGVKKFGNVYAIDTSAVFGELGEADDGHLTLVDVCTATTVLLGPWRDVRNFNSDRHPLARFKKYGKI